MDNLRALAMLAGVVFHAALAYSPMLRPYWPPADAGGSGGVDVGAWFLHLFRMPLFFVVSGFFAALLVSRRGLAGLFRQRLQRVFVPLLVFLPLVLLGMEWLTVQAANSALQPSPALAWVRAYLQEHGALPLTGLAHLWFLFYLLLFTLLVWIASALELERAGRWLAALPPAALALGLPLLMAPMLALTGVPWPAPESFVPSLWALGYFGLHFAFGYQLFRQPALLDGLRRWMPALLLGAIAAYAALPWVLGGDFAGPDAPLRHTLHATLEAYAGFWMTLWCLLAGKRWLDRRSRAMRWLADASYWVYLVHLPVLFAIQYRLLDLALPWPAKFAISTLATLVLCFASYQLLVRHTVIGRWLNGTRLPEPVAGH